jgi:hypothetical protein
MGCSPHCAPGRRFASRAARAQTRGDGNKRKPVGPAADESTGAIIETVVDIMGAVEAATDEDGGGLCQKTELPVALNQFRAIVST